MPLAAAQAVGVLCGIFGVRWSSSVIPPEVLGIYGLLLSTTQFATTVTHQGTLKHVQRFWTAELSPRTYVTEVVRGAGRATAAMLVGVAAALLGLQFIGGSPFGATVLAWAALANVLVLASAAAQVALQAEMRYWAAFFISAVGSIGRSFLPPLLAVTAGAAVVWLASGFLLHLVAQLGCVVLVFWRLWPRPGTMPVGATAALPKMMPAFALVGLCGWLAAVAPRWVAAPILGDVEVGYFVLAGNLSLVVPATFGGIALSQSFPLLFQAARDGADARTLLRMTDRVLAAVLVGSQLVLLLLAWIGPELVGLVISVRYAEATGWLLATGGGALAATTTQFYHNALLARDQERACLLLSAGSAVFRIGALLAAAVVSVDAFRLALIALPWATVVLERAFTGWQLIRGQPQASVRDHAVRACERGP